MKFIGSEATKEKSAYVLWIQHEQQQKQIHFDI